MTISRGTSPIMYAIMADSQAFAPGPAFRIDIAIPKKGVTVWMTTRDANSK